MKELSIFIDESGDFGETQDSNAYYLVTFVFHNQSNEISFIISIKEGFKMNVFIAYVGYSSEIIDELTKAGFEASLQKKTVIGDKEITVPSGTQLIYTEADYDDIIQVINQSDNDDLKRLASNQERIPFDIKSNDIRQRFRRLNIAFAEVE